MFGVWDTGAKASKALESLEPCQVAAERWCLFTLPHEKTHCVSVTLLLYFLLLLTSHSLKVLQNLKSRWDRSLTLLVFPDKVCQSNPEFGSDLGLDLLRKLPNLFESKEVKIGLILLKLLSDEVQIIGELVIFFSN